MMLGFHANTGEPIAGLEHLKQSIRDILTTPIGTRVMRRDYGSRLFELIDRPWNESLKIELYAATAEALASYEPRLQLERVQAQLTAPGQITLHITGKIKSDLSQTLTMSMTL